MTRSVESRQDTIEITNTYFTGTPSHNIQQQVKELSGLVTQLKFLFHKTLTEDRGLHLIG